MARPQLTNTFSPYKAPTFRPHTEGGDVSLVLGAQPVKILTWRARNLTSVAGFIQVHDAVSLPSPGAVPLWELPLPADGANGDDMELPCLVGAVLAISTTSGTLTISTNDALLVAVVENTTRPE